jgi:hypothetical protein
VITILPDDVATEKFRVLPKAMAKLGIFKLLFTAASFPSLQSRLRILSEYASGRE